MTKEEMDLQRTRLNRARSIMDEREGIADVLKAIASGNQSSIVITVQSGGAQCGMPLSEIRDLLTDRLIDYDRRLAEKLEAL